MSTIESAKNYMLLYREIQWGEDMTQSQIEDVSERIMLWYEELLQRGVAKLGHPLDNVGRVLVGKHGQPVMDGPFIEGKEAIGGFVWITADSLEEATRIAGENPALAYGLTIEIREIVAECPIYAEAKKRRELDVVG